MRRILAGPRRLRSKVPAVRVGLRIRSTSEPDQLRPTLAGAQQSGLLFLSPGAITRAVRSLLEGELKEDPTDLVVNLLLQCSRANLSSKAFASSFPILHGEAKLTLVRGLALGKLWSYPAAIVFFGRYAIYRTCRLAQLLLVPERSHCPENGVVVSDRAESRYLIRLTRAPQFMHQIEPDIGKRGAATALSAWLGAFQRR
jgi:Predicted membrane protein (DUF2127)